MLTLEGGTTILVEVSDVGSASGRRALGGAAITKFSDAIGSVHNVAKSLHTEIERLAGAARPDGVSVTFGMKFTAEAGGFLAKLGGDSNFSITLTWNRANKTAG